jgi:hypothetical protein
VKLCARASSAAIRMVKASAAGQRRKIDGIG